MIISERDGDVLWLRLDRPEKKNAVGPAAMVELRTILQKLSQDDSLRLLVLTL